MGYSPFGHKALDTTEVTEHAHTHTHKNIITVCQHLEDQDQCTMGAKIALCSNRGVRKGQIGRANVPSRGSRAHQASRQD